MSRTYRRQGARYNLDWVLRENVWVDGFFRHTYFELDSREGKKAMARYFSDAGCGSYGHGTPPHWYRRYLNHRADRREEQRLHHWLRNSDQDRELIFLPRVRDANYYW